MAPSGDQYEISASGYRAVVTESGAALRRLEHGGRDLVDGFGDDEMAYGGRGQLLMPWPNRLRDGRYRDGEAQLQLALTEPGRHNASHGLVRWAAWSLQEHTDHSVALGYRLVAQTGYPWTLDLHVVYDLSAEGLTVTQTATNLATTAAPYAQGAHPYLTVGPGPVDTWELTLPGGTRLLADAERKLPTGREPVEGTPVDFRVARPVRDVVLDHAYTDLARGDGDRARVLVRDPATGRAVCLWVDGLWPWLMVYTADDQPATARRSLAVEPMTAPADAFNSGEDVVRLEPEATFSASWGIQLAD